MKSWLKNNHSRHWKLLKFSQKPFNQNIAKMLKLKKLWKLCEIIEKLVKVSPLKRYKSGEKVMRNVWNYVKIGESFEKRTKNLSKMYIILKIVQKS